MGVSNFSAQRTGIALAAMVNAIRRIFTGLGMVVIAQLGPLKHLPIISLYRDFTVTILSPIHGVDFLSFRF